MNRAGVASRLYSFPRERKVSMSGPLRLLCHFGVTMTPTILSFIASTSALACSSVVPLSNSNPTGAISDPRELADVELAERPEARPQVVQAHILEPVPADA